MKRSRTIFVARLLLRAIVLSVLGLCGGLGAPDQARAQVFVCDSADAGESGEFASAGGGGSNFAGIAFPFMGHALRGGRKVRIVAVEPVSCNC